MNRRKRFLATVCALGLLAPMANAKPWYRDWRVWAVVGLSLGSSVAATHEAHECRERFGPAPCQGGYGPFAAREGVRFGLSALLSAHAIYGRHAGYREWPVFALGLAAYNTSVAVRQARVGCPIGQEFIYGTKFSCRPSDEFREGHTVKTRP